jgi:hypothetical protein
MACGSYGMWKLWHVEVMACGSYGMWKLWHVEVVACGNKPYFIRA